MCRAQSSKMCRVSTFHLIVRRMESAACQQGATMEWTSCSTRDTISCGDYSVRSTQRERQSQGSKAQSCARTVGATAVACQERCPHGHPGAWRGCTQTMPARAKIGLRAAPFPRLRHGWAGEVVRWASLRKRARNYEIANLKQAAGRKHA